MNIKASVADTREGFSEENETSLRPSTMTWDLFWQHFGGAFEHAPDLAKLFFDRGLSPKHDTAEGLHEGFCAVLRSVSNEKKLQILNEPPDLAGTLLRASELSPDSMIEQSSAGLDRLSEREYERFIDLNTRYRTRFGFPFIMAVKNRDKTEILTAFELRINNSLEREMEIAGNWVERIVLLRLREIFDAA